MREVAVTGLGAITPLGVGAPALLERWVAGECAIRDGEAPCVDFDPLDFLSAKDVRRADRFTQLALAAASEALDHAGWTESPEIVPERSGCIIGTGIGGMQTLEASHTVLLERGAKNVSPLSVPLMMSNAAPAAVAMAHGLRGPVFGVVSACAAGAHAIGTALRAVQCGDADAVIAGGAEATLTPLARAAFASLGATSPSGRSLPFDLRRDGFVMGEGAGVLVLEAADHARARGAEILATVRGYGATSDAHHLTAPQADGTGAADAMTAALADAGLDAADIDYVNAHGTSTPLNDRAETLALKRSLGEHAGRVPVSSTKSAIGHLLGAAGAVEAVATVLSLRQRVAPPTIGWEQADEGMDLDYVPGHARALEIDGDRHAIALSNSFGFGGHNAVLCLEAA